MKKQRILSLLLALAMVFSLLPANAMAVDVENFTDVSKDAWYYKYVDFVAEEEYFVGTSKTTFSPEMPMTRAMFVTVLAAVEGVEVDNNVSPFADVPANTWYSGAVAWAAEKGVVAGIGNNKFAPDTAISREQMAVMMDAYVKWHSKVTGETHREKSKVEGFGDADKISSWAKASVEKCRNWGLIAGMPDGNFYPQNTASRAEVATVIYNLVWLISGGGGGGGGTGGGAHTAHTYGDWTQTKAPTCTEKGEETRYCTYTGCTAKETREIDPLGHNYVGTVTTEPTCVENGVKTYVCQNDASHTYTEDIPAKGHVDENGDYICDVCGAKLCLNHVEETIPGVAATCIQTGLTEGKKCSICGEILVAQQIIGLADHTPKAAVRENEVPATCTVPGSYDEVIYCSVCDAEISRVSKTTDLAKHTPGTAVKEDHIAPSDTVEGCYDMVVYCSVCGAEISREHNPIYDYIYRAVSAAIADVKGDIEDKINHNIPSQGEISWKDSYVQITGLTLGGPNAVGSTEHPITVEATADIGTDSLKSIVKFAARNAVELAGGLVAIIGDADMNDVDAVKAKIVELVEKIVDVLETKMDVNITLSKESIADIAEYVYDVCKAGAADAYQYGASYVKGLREHFVEADGYVTGDVDVTVGGYTVTIDVEKNSASLVELSGDEKVIAIATDIAKAALDKMQNIDAEALYITVKNAAVKALALTDAVVSNYVDAEALARNIVAALKNKLDIDLNRQYIADLANEIYDYCKSKAPAIRDDAEALKDILNANRERITAVAYIAAGMAKEMYADLKTYNEYTDLNDIVLDTTVKVNFSGEYSDGVATAYKADTDNFPYVYPVTFKMQMDDRGSDTTIGDNIQYMYDNGHFVNIKVTEKAKAAYEKMILAAKDKVMSIDAIQKQVNEIVKNAGLDKDTVYNKAYNELGESLIEVLEKLGMSKADAQAYVEAKLNEWTATNVPADITKSPLIDLFITGSSDGNQALYDIVNKIAALTTEYMKTYEVKIGNANVTAFDLLELSIGDGEDDTPDTIREILYGMTNPDKDGFRDEFQKSLLAKLNALEATGLSDYVFAYIFDEIRGTAYAKAAEADMHAVIDGKLLEVAKDAVAAKVNADQLAKLKQLEKLGALASIDSFKDVELSALAPVLTNEYVQKVIAKYEDNIVARYTALLRFIPDEAALVLPNGAVVNEAALAGVRDAETFGEACQAVAELLKQFGGLSLSDFATTQKFTVKYGDRQATVGLQIEIAE